MKNIILHCNVMLRAVWKFPLSYGPIVFDLGGPATKLSACLPQDELASGAHICRSLAPRNHTLQGQITNRIGVFRHRNIALFK
jgi:hypothetical protein